MHPLTPDQTHAYLAHLGLPAPQRLDREALDALIGAHLARVAFENLDVLLARPIHIDAERVFAKVVERGRGGYCFELNGLFGRLLMSLGFRVTPLVARVRWGLPAEAPLTLTSHLMLRIDLADGAYLADVGFGSANPTRALPLEGHQGLGDLPFRLLPPSETQGDFHLETRIGEAWLPVYHFDLQPQPWIDYTPRNWYTSTHPDSLFCQMLVAARTEPGQRLTLRNGLFTRRTPDGQAHQRTLTDPDAVLEVLQHEFRLALRDDDLAALRQRLAALLAATPG